MLVNRMGTQILVCLVASYVCLGCRPRSEAPAQSAPVRQLPPVDLANLRPQVDAFCGNCHSPPPAESFPKQAWRMEVERGFDFYFESFREDLTPPPKEETIAYFESLAPEKLQVSSPDSASSLPVPIEFRRSFTKASAIDSPAVSFITWQSLQRDGKPLLIFSDMRSGELRTASLFDHQTECSLMSTCANPAHLEPCDLDGDGQRDFVVAELGSDLSGDHSRGAVIWLRPDGNGWKQRLLLSGLGRVADVRPGDFDGDGDSDLLVAEFGHFRTGRILWLENTSLSGGVPRFRQHVIDERHGTIHVPTADLDGDGHLDFVALISQEYELVEAFLNQGDATFRREPIFSGKDPAFGSSGIQLVDLDADGDLDVLYSNGDTFGSEYLKPYHGIRWLECRGGYPFEDHFLTGMVGVQKALAADLDGDHDLDIVAVALMPKNLVASPELQAHDSVIWLEQTQRGTFVRHALERNQFYHAALELADLDSDGDLDLVIGNMHPEGSPTQPWLTLWWNHGARGRVGSILQPLMRNAATRVAQLSESGARLSDSESQAAASCRHDKKCTISNAEGGP